ncbi:TPA: ABC transporter ATP-binding protein [Escherichia coli]|nr:ABC transporter ATP-binding protein [Escherichia coli]
MIDIFIKKRCFGDRTLLHDVSLKLNYGDFLVLTGPSGSGKSTLLSIIGMLDFDFEGVYIFDSNVIDLKCNVGTSSIREKYFGYVFQDSLINEKQSIKRNLLCSVDYKNQKKHKIYINTVLNMVGLHDITRDTSVLSGGEKQRLAVARALIKQPSILLADEPTASLDRENKIKIMEILENFRAAGGIVVMVTHDLELLSSNMKVLNINSYE